MQPRARCGEVFGDLRDAIVGGVVRGVGWLGFRGLFHGITEIADAVAQTLAEFRQFLGSEHEQCNSHNHEQMGRLKKSFEHKVLIVLL